MNLTSQLINQLKKMVNKTTIDDLMQLAPGVVESAQNSFSALSGPLQGTINLLGADTPAGNTRFLNFILEIIFCFFSRILFFIF